MISPVTKTISGFEVRFRPLPATKAFTLAKRVGAALLPILSTLDLNNLKAEVDIAKLLGGFQEILSKLPDETAVGIITDSLRGYTITPPGEVPVEINSTQDVDKVFQGELDALYEIVGESWRYNKLAPFKLAARFGFQMKETDTSSEAGGTGTRPGVALAK